ncbi:MAG: hypothetical protein ACHQET_02605, partial [Chitinophagales bacterium]
YLSAWNDVLKIADLTSKDLLAINFLESSPKNRALASVIFLFCIKKLDQKDSLKYNHLLVYIWKQRFILLIITKYYAGS